MSMTMRRVCLYAAILAIPDSVAWCVGWFQYQAGDQKAGTVAQEKVTQLVPRFEFGLWSTSNSETTFTSSSAVVGGATLYIGTSGGDVVVVGGKSGTESWRVVMRAPLTGAPLIYGDTVVVASTDGTLLALDGSANGAEMWRYSAPAPLAGSPTLAVVAGQLRLYAVTTGGNITCLRLGDGGFEWTATAEGSIWCSPSYSAERNRVYVAGYDGILRAYDASTGQSEWVTDQDIELGSVRATVPVLADRLYVSTLTNGLVAIEDTSTGPQERWRLPETGSIAGSPAVVPSAGLASAVIYVANDDGYLFAIEDRGPSGVIVWTRSVGARVAGSVAYVDGKVFVASEAGALHAFRADTGVDWATANMKAPCDSSLAVSKGRVYAQDGAGILYAFGNTLDPPEGLSAVAQGIGQVHLSWTPVSLPPMQTPVSGYGIYRSVSPDGDLVRVGYITSKIVDESGQPTGLTASTYVDTTITASGVYYYAVTALNEMTGQPPMEESTYSDLASVEVVLPPPPPSDLTALGGDGYITLSWHDPVSRQLQALQLYRRDVGTGVLELIRVLSPSAESFVDVHVENGREYGYVVTCVAMDGQESIQTAEALAIPLTVDWPMFQRDARHDAYNPQWVIESPLAFHWYADIPNTSGWAIGQNFLVVSGTVFVGNGFTCMALSAESGVVLWQKSLWGFTAIPPAYFAGKLYQTTQQGLFVIDADNGSFGPPVLPVYNAEWAPIIYRGVLYISNGGYELIAYDTETQSVMWRLNTPGAYGMHAVAPTAANGRIYLLTSAGVILTYDAGTGQAGPPFYLDNPPRWFVATALTPEQDPAMLLAADYYGTIYGFDTKVPFMAKWKRGFTGQPLSPAVAGSTIVVTSEQSSTVTALRASDGTLIWSATIDGAAVSSPIVVGNRVLVASNIRVLYSFDLSTGSIVDIVDTRYVPGGQLSAGSNYILVTCNMGARISAITIAPPEPTGLTVIASVEQMTVSWTKPVYAYPIAGYKLYFSHGIGDQEYELADDINGSATSYSVPCTPGIIYYWRIRAKDSRGLWSDYAGPVSATAFFQPDVVAEITSPVEGASYCVSAPLTLTVTGTASSGNFAGYSLEVDQGAGYVIAQEGSAPVIDGLLGTVTLTNSGPISIRLTVSDETGATKQAIRQILAPAKNLLAQVDWPSPGTVLTTDCGQVPFSLTVVGVAKGDRFSAYRLELARMSATLAVIASNSYNGPVSESGYLGMVVLPDCDFYIVRLVALDTCGRTQTSEMEITLQDGQMLVASIITFSTRGKDPGEHRRPMDVAVDNEDYVWVVDTMNRRLQKYTAEGQLLFEVGGQETGMRDGLGFREPIAAAVTAGNEVLVLDRLASQVIRLDESGSVLGRFGSQGQALGQFLHPEGLATDRIGRIYVADTLNNRIQVLDSGGSPIAAFGSEGVGLGQFEHPSGVSIDPVMGNIIVADTLNNRVQIFGPDGSYLNSFGTQGAGPGALNWPYEGIAGVTHNLFVPEVHNNRVSWYTLFGSTAGWLTALPPLSYNQPLFKQPHGAALDREESMLYVADTGNNRIVGIPIRRGQADTLVPRAVISTPVDNQTVNGVVEVRGIAADAHFASYVLEYGAGETPEQFRIIVQSGEPVWGGQLGLWDTSGLAAGTYVIRLTVSDKSGNQSQASIRVILQGTMPPLIADVSALPVPFMPDRSGLTISYRLSKPAEVRLVIQDSDSGLPIWGSETLAAGGKGGQLGANALLWDGRDEQGKVAVPGQYTVVVVARAGDVRDRRAVLVEAAMSPELQAALHGGPISGSGMRSPGGAVTGGAAGTAVANPASSGSSPSSGTSGGTSLPAEGTHDNGMDNGANPKDFERGSNPGKHEGR
jgi:outer membrane protein assembly factor BamB